MNTKFQVKYGGMSECFVYECECTYTNKSYTCISARKQIYDVFCIYECECTHTNKSHTCISACIQICDVLGRGTDMDTKLQVKCDGMSECFVYERERTYTNNQEVCIRVIVHVYDLGITRIRNQVFVYVPTAT